MENVKLDTIGKQADMKACYILGRSLKQLILPERLHAEIRTVCHTCVNHLEPGFTLQNSTFFPQCVYMFLLIADQTAIISLQNHLTGELCSLRGTN
jgi:hypothetical protein